MTKKAGSTRTKRFTGDSALLSDETLGFLQFETRGLLYSVGNRIYAFGKSRLIETDADIAEAVKNEGILKDLSLDDSLILRAMRASKDGKLASKRNCFSAWASAATDKAARDILDNAATVTAHPVFVRNENRKQ